MTALDACGTSRTVMCGTCGAGWSCQSNVCRCVPATCSSLGMDCGSVTDGCGRLLSCGICSAPQSCGGGGTPNVCGCAPTTCTALGADCGNPPDGCGGTLSCGSCAPGATCGGGGAPYVCGCIPKTCQSLGKNCGNVDDGCGGTLQCGTCPSPQVCGAGQFTNVCLERGYITDRINKTFMEAYMDPKDWANGPPCLTVFPGYACSNGTTPIGTGFRGYCKPQPTSTMLTSLYTTVTCTP